jgi:nicotinate-nucleotide--dimethylbenzimidazole phosphoribosyltransferase
MNIGRLTLVEMCGGIAAVSEEWRSKARLHLDTLTKPLGSLGRLEDIAAQMVAIRQGESLEPLRKGVTVFAADHGVTAEGVSAYPSEVTRQMVLNFLAEGAAINVLSRLHGVVMQVVDVGVDTDFSGVEGLRHEKVRRGTRNMLREAAMSEDEVLAALRVGFGMAVEAKAAGLNLIAMGEMGIGNTTAASAMTAVLTGCSVPRVTGQGTGVVGAMYLRKREVIAAVIESHFGAMPVQEAEPLEVLRRVGGLEIAAMTGMTLGAAREGLAVVCDGFISTAAAALAVALAPAVKNYLFAGHQSEEPGHRILLEHLGLAPILTLGMRLGEGTGAVLAMPVIESAMSLYREMATFRGAGVSEATA